MNFNFKYFRSKEQAVVRTLQLWEVRWMSRYDMFGTSTRPEIRVFPSREEAVEFAKALKDAFKLIKHTSGTRVVMSKQQEDKCQD